jgi:hypothetical protein
MTGEDIAFTYESVATSATAEQMARAFLRLTMRRRRFRTFFGAIWILLGAYLAAYGYSGRDVTPLSRVVASMLVAGAFTLLPLLAVAALIYFGNRRNFGQTVRPGTAMRTGFGEDEFVTSNSLSSSRFSYRAVRSVEVVDRFVFIRYVGQPVVRCYPCELFPDDALQRLNEAAEQS